MAIDVLKRQGKSAVTGVLGKNLRRITGNIGSVIRGDVGADSSEFSPINRSKQSTKMLSFPIDVGADPGIGNHGHYIMFFINEQDHAKLKFGGGYGGDGAQDMGLENVIGEAAKRKLKGVTKGFDSKIGNFLDKFNPNKISNQLLGGLTDTIGGFGLGTKGRIKTEVKHQIRADKDQNVEFERSPTTRLDTAISMYMPPSVKTSYKSNYTDTAMSAFSVNAVQAATQLMEGAGATDPKVKENLKVLGYKVSIKKQREFLLENGFNHFYDDLKKQYIGLEGIEKLKINSELNGLKAILDSNGLGGFYCLVAEKI